MRHLKSSVVWLSALVAGTTTVYSALTALTAPDHANVYVEGSRAFLGLVLTLAVLLGLSWAPLRWLRRRLAHTQRPTPNASVPQPYSAPTKQRPAKQPTGKKLTVQLDRAKTAQVSTPPPSAKRKPGPPLALGRIRHAVTQIAVQSVAFILGSLGTYLVIALVASRVATLTPAQPTQSPTPGPAPTETASPTQAPSPTETLLPTAPPHSPIPQPTYAWRWDDRAPPAPTYVELDYLPCASAFRDEECRWVEASWPKQTLAGIEIRIYAVTKCWHTATTSRVLCAVPGDPVKLENVEMVCSIGIASGSCLFPMTKPSSTTFLDSLPGRGGAAVFAYLAQAVNQYGGSDAWIPLAAWSYPTTSGGGGRRPEALTLAHAIQSRRAVPGSIAWQQ